MRGAQRNEAGAKDKMAATTTALISHSATAAELLSLLMLFDCQGQKVQQSGKKLIAPAVHWAGPAPGYPDVYSIYCIILKEQDMFINSALTLLHHCLRKLATLFHSFLSMGIRYLRSLQSGLARNYSRPLSYLIITAALIGEVPFNAASAQPTPPSERMSGASSTPDSGPDASKIENQSVFFDKLSGDWFGLRGTLLNQGVRLEPVFTGESSANLAGGVRRKVTYLDDVDLKLTIDTQRFIGWPDATFFVYGLGTHGGNPSDAVGNAQVVSSIAAPSGWQLYEAWVQQNFLNNRLSLLAGQFDLNAEFYVLQSATLFLNSSYGIGPEFSGSGRGGPSIFPYTSVGARVEVRPSQSVVLRTAILDGVPVNVRRSDGNTGIFMSGDGLLIVEEVDYLIEPKYKPAGASVGEPRGRRLRSGRAAVVLPYEGKIGLGGWYYTAKFNDLNLTTANSQPVQHSGSSGFYLLAEQVFYPFTSAERSLTLFGQFGIGDSRVNRFASSIESGFTISSPFDGRGSDQFGFGVAAARNGAEFASVQQRAGRRSDTSEVIIELTYLAQVTPWLVVQPDLQYVINPNTDPLIRNALVFAVRFEISF
ncbi:MAG: carbohydrate porin [Burkholderiales bacterium]